MLGTNISISSCTGESGISVGSSVSRSWDCHVYRYCNRTTELLTGVIGFDFDITNQKGNCIKAHHMNFTTGLPAIKKKVYHQGNRRYMYKGNTKQIWYSYSALPENFWVAVFIADTSVQAVPSDSIKFFAALFVFNFIMIKKHDFVLLNNTF